jgi:hypothetical protein
MMLKSKINSVLSKHIEYISKKICSRYTSIDAIILYGSYGRDEGGWYIDKNGKYSPYNDYDILIVSDEKKHVNTIRTLKKEMAAEIGIRWIDIGQKNMRELCKYNPSIYNYDLKYGSKVIYGQKQILSKIPEYPANEIPLHEIEVLFFTRLWTLLGSLEDKGVSSDRVGESSRFFRNQMAKAILSIVDVKLLLLGKYSSSYKKRVRDISGLFLEYTELIDLAEWAINEKLSPSGIAMTSIENEELYGRVNKIFLNVMYEGLSSYYGATIEGPEQIEKQVKWSARNLFYRAARVLLKRNMGWEHHIGINLAQAYLAAAYESELKDEYIKKASMYIMKIDTPLQTSDSWDVLRERVCELRMIV